MQICRLLLLFLLWQITFLLGDWGLQKDVREGNLAIVNPGYGELFPQITKVAFRGTCHPPCRVNSWRGIGTALLIRNGVLLSTVLRTENKEIEGKMHLKAFIPLSAWSSKILKHRRQSFSEWLDEGFFCFGCCTLGTHWSGRIKIN